MRSFFIPMPRMGNNLLVTYVGKTPGLNWFKISKNGLLLAAGNKRKKLESGSLRLL